MLVIGCGPIGLELSQSMVRFGCKVICFEMGLRLLPREDPDAATILEAQLRSDGVEFHMGVKLMKVEYTGDAACRTAAPWGCYRVHVETGPGVVEIFEVRPRIYCPPRPILILFKLLWFFFVFIRAKRCSTPLEELRMCTTWAWTLSKSSGTTGKG